MKLATLCFLIRQEKPRQVLLGFKKEGFGKGKYVGYGGKIEANETSWKAIIRELQEEAHITLQKHDLCQIAHILFCFPNMPSWDHDVIVFIANKWEGEAIETHEMEPFWFRFEDIPYTDMWDDSHFWLPQILAGNQVESKYIYDKDNRSVLSIEEFE